MPASTTSNYNERAKLAHKLRSEGKSFRAIGEELGCTHARASFLYRQWLQQQKAHSHNYEAFGPAADLWPIQVTTALLNSGVVNIDHLQQIIIHHQLACTPANGWYAYSRNFTFRKLGHKSWTEHILPYLASIGFDYTPYVHKVDLTRPKRKTKPKPKPVEAS